MLKRFLVITAAVALMCSPSFAGDQPEFDTVGCDATNYFNDLVDDLVTEGNLYYDGTKINEYSDFTGLFDPKDLDNMEYFRQTAGALKADNVCFPGYMNALVDAWNSAEFTWKIVLQKKPQSDLDINIRDCVVKHNSFTIFGASSGEGAEQTGRFTWPWGEVDFWRDSNPMITVEALPGQYSTIGFDLPQLLVGLMTPSLEPIALSRAYYTSKAVWEESIVAVMPETGDPLTVASGPGFRLKAGDMIKVYIEVPGTNTADIRYGQDNVTVKYVGIHGTEYINDIDLPCAP